MTSHFLIFGLYLVILMRDFGDKVVFTVLSALFTHYPQYGVLTCFTLLRHRHNSLHSVISCKEMTADLT